MAGRLTLTLVVIALGTSAWAEPPTPSPELATVPIKFVATPDTAALRVEDAEREAAGLPPRFAIANETVLTPESDGKWEEIDSDNLLWRLRINSPEALSINLGFTAYYMPPNGELTIYSPDGKSVAGPFTAADNQDYAQLWTPIIPGPELVVELRIPVKELNDLVLELGSINVGYRGFGESLDKAGTCNIDVVCPQSAGWEAQIKSVGVYTVGGTWTCTGALVNNTAQDKRPFFLTANHCSVTSSNAGSVVVYWNFQSPTCGQHGGGSLNQYQSGATWRASYSTSDFTLIEFNSAPSAAFDVVFAGWDRSNTAPAGAVCIHHPNCDEKSISFDTGTCPITTYLSNTSPGDSTHLKTDWDTGVTEPGSSGSPLFNMDHRIVGQLHGGDSACGSSDMRDWYGRVYRSWTGGGANTSRLSNWLDPSGTGATTLDYLYNNIQSGLQVTPSTGLDSAGNAGGPFTPSSVAFVVKNAGGYAVSYLVSHTQTWNSITNASGTLAVGAQVTVTVALTAAANSLGNGTYTDTIVFTNTTDGVGNTTRPAKLVVGVPSLVYSWPLDTDPGWTKTGSWAFGTPVGGNGDHGSPDPTSGYTGTRVYGYALGSSTAGGYTNSMSEQTLTSTAINCSGLTQVRLKFWRWLGVEKSTYDHAYVRVSSNGSTWTTVWQNSTSDISDTAWAQQDFDISAVADNQATVYLRWVMGTTDGSYTFCVWNIDDVQIWGLSNCSGPSFSQQPQSATRCSGQSVTFSVTAAGSGTLTYQWRKGGSNIGGATGNSYTINAVTTGDVGSYDCVVTNACGSVPSNAATLSVNTGPSFSQQPQSATRCSGQSVTFSVTAAGSGTLTYQWRKGGNDIGGATGNSYTINAVATGDIGSYDCVVTNDCGSVPSNAATLAVNTGPQISGQPASQSVAAGSSVSFTVTATGSGTLSYQWRKGGTDIGGATGSTYTIDSVTTADAGDYDCVVTNGCGSVPSDAATLSVSPAVCVGDANCDGTINWRDIDYLVAAQNDNVSAWTALFPGGPSCTIANVDVNGDEHVNWRDIDPFIALMNTSCP